jgi:hypothetical protein
LPWTPADARRHKRGLSAKQARQWAHVANSMLKSCMDRGGSQSRCEGRAVRAANAAVGTPARPVKHDLLLHIHTTLTTRPRREVSRGAEYLVCDCVMAIAGVLNGSLLTAEALVPQDWQAIPIVLDHPADHSGVACSARHPSVLATCGIGQVFHARLGQGKRGTQRVPSLVSELWINRSEALHCGAKGLEVLTRLDRGEPVECSTAFFSEGFAQRGEFEGQPYTEVYTRVRPDHLAILLDSVGACSLADGCGVLRMNQDTLTYDSPCTCADPSACHCHEDLPMTATPSLPYLQRLWSGLQDLMQRASSPTLEAEKPSASEEEHPAEPTEDEMPDEEEDEDDETEAEVAFADHPSDEDHAAPRTEETSMPATDVIKRRVNALIANARTRWTEEDRHMLESQGEAFLIRLEQQPLDTPMTVGDPQTAEEAIDRMPLHLQETMRTSYARLMRHKTACIDRLVTEVKDCFYTREKLETMEEDELHGLLHMAHLPVPGDPVGAEPNYHGRRLPHLRIVTPEGEDNGQPPPLMDTMSLIVAKQKERGVRF